MPLARPGVEEFSFISMVKQLASSVAVDRILGVDSLISHIQSCGLNLQKVGISNTTENCWYYSVFELCKLQGIVLPPGVKTPHDLQLAIVESIKNHPSFSGTAESTETDLLWFRDLWGSQHSRVDKFMKQHRTDEQYTDNKEIIVFATQNLLKVNLNIVSSSCNKEHPITVYSYQGKDEAAGTIYISYYQDESHRGGPGGHYHGLQKQPEIEVVQMTSGTRAKIQQLEKELIDLSKEPGALLKTLTDIEKTDISQEDIMNSQLAGLLMESIRPLYDTTTQHGRITRRLLAKYSDLLRTGVEDW